MPSPTLAERANFPVITALLLLAVTVLWRAVITLNEVDKAYASSRSDRHATQPRFVED